MAKNEVIYQGLSELNVIIEDTSANSPDYFRVTDLPTELTAGLNTFKFKGNVSLFPENSVVYIEILDANGLPVYYEVGIDLESQDQLAIVTIFINEDTTPGNGSIIICSTLNQSAEGQILDPSEINVRWQVPIYIDISKRNEDAIIFSSLPRVTLTSSTGSHKEISYYDFNAAYPTANKSQTQLDGFTASGTDYIKYYYNNDTPVIVLPANMAQTSYDNGAPIYGFLSHIENASISFTYNRIVNSDPTRPSNIVQQAASASISSFSGSLIAYLSEPLSYELSNSNDRFYPKALDLSRMNVTYVMPTEPDAFNYVFSNTTQNTYNIVTASFSNLQPLTGEISKIITYYRSSGINEYILLNETDITSYAEEFGFNTSSLQTTFSLPTSHRNEKIDFKFEFVNSAGNASKQVVEVRDRTLIGGNTYIGGDDNLMTGSLFVAGATGTGVHISGKGNAAMIRSIGYEGFAKAVAGTGRGGFVIYSGSVQPLLNASEQYSGVGIELFANTSSYFKYTTSGSGMLDIKTDSFFLGSANQFISGANGNIEISSSNFHLDADGNVEMEGDINAINGIFENVTIIGQVPSSSISSSMSKPWLLESWVTSSSDRFNIKFVSTASAGNFQSGKPYDFTAGGTFKIGLLQWTASIESGSRYTYTGSLAAKAYDPFPRSVTVIRDFPDLLVLEPYTSASVHVSATAPYSSSFISMLNYGITGSAYIGGDKFDVKPTAPIGFSKWAEIHGTYDVNSYNGIGMETTSSTSHSIVNNPFYPYIGTIDTVVFPTPRVSYIPSSSVYNPVTGLPTQFGTSSRNAGRVQTEDFTYEGAYAFCITSEIITLDTSLLGLDQYGKLINEPLGIQFAAKYCALESYRKTWVTYEAPLVRYSGTGKKGLIEESYVSRRLPGTYKPIGATWPEYWKRDIRCDIIGIDPILGTERLLISQNQSTAGTINWSMFNIPLSLVLTTDTEDDIGSQVVYNKFRIKLSWRKGYRADIEDDTTSGLIRFSEIRILKYPSSEGLHVPSLQLEDSAFLSDKEATQHFGNFKPSSIDSYDLGSDLLSWKDIYASGVIQMTNKFDQVRIGNNAGYENNGENSTFIGTFAGESSLSSTPGANAPAGNNSVMIGHETGRYSNGSTTSNVVFIGEAAGKNAQDTSGSVFIGSFTGTNAYNAQNSVMIGTKAGYNAQNAQYSILLGYRSGYAITTADSIGANNIIIGNNIALPSSATSSLNIGGVLFGTGLYDDSANNFETNPPFTGSVSNGKIGVNKRNPAHNLDVSGSANISGSFISGRGSVAPGQSSHAEGYFTTASGSYSHAEGASTQARGNFSHTEGQSTKTFISKAYKADYFNVYPGEASSEIRLSGSYLDVTSKFKIGDTIVYSDENYANVIAINDTIADVYYTAPHTYIIVSNDWDGEWSGADGIVYNYSTPSSEWTGNQNFNNSTTHAEGINTIAFGYYSHAEGQNTISQGQSSHAEGFGTEAVGFASHAEGSNTIAQGSYQHVQGQFNISSSAQSAFIIGNGTSNSARRNLVFASGSQVQITGSLLVSGSLNVTTSGTGQTTILARGNDAAFRLTTRQDVSANTDGAVIGELGVDYTTTRNAAVRFHRGASTTGGFITFTTNNGSERVRITSGGAMGLGVTPTNTSGRFEASNDIVAYSSSDKNWKTNIKNINSPLEKLSQINGVEFDWIEDEPVHGNKGHDVGVIAQEIEQILPEAVQTRESGMKAVQYDKMIPLLVECIKAQQTQIEELKQIINGITR